MATPDNYGSSIQTGPNDQTQVVIVNQTEPVIVAHPILPTKLGTFPVYMNCPNCKTSVMTNVEKKWSWASCCLCCWTGLLILFLIQLCRDKQITCYDAKHTCPKCGRILGEFESC